MQNLQNEPIFQNLVEGYNTCLSWKNTKRNSKLNMKTVIIVTFAIGPLLTTNFSGADEKSNFLQQMKQY